MSERAYMESGRNLHRRTPLLYLALGNYFFLNNHLFHISVMEKAHDM